MAALELFSDFVLVRKDPEVEEMTAGGLYKPDIAKLESNEGEVVAVSIEGRWNGQEFIPLTQKVGDRVLVSRVSGMKVLVDGEELWMFHADDVYARRSCSTSLAQSA